MYLSREIAVSSEFILLGIAYCFSFVTLLVYYAFQNKGRAFSKLGQLKLADLLVGPFGYFVYSVSLIQSFREFGTASEPTILNYTWPIFTVLFTEWLFRGKTKRAVTTRIVEGFGVVIGLVAVVVLATEGQLTSLEVTNLSGLGWGLLAGASYGFFSAYSSTVAEDNHSLFLLGAVMISIILISFFSLREIPLLVSFTPKNFLFAAILGFALDGIGYITWTRANRLVRQSDSISSIASIASMMYILPLLSLVIIVILLGEGNLFEVYFAISLILVIVSAVVCQKADQLAGLASRWDNSRD